MTTKNVLSWIPRVVAAIILLQTLYFKFTAQPESVELFSKLGAEPWGRIGTGIIELTTAILLLIPTTAFAGAMAGVGVMMGAIASHIIVIGIQSQGDGGQLFLLAVVVLFCCAVTLILHRQQGLQLYRRYIKKN